MIAPDTAAGAPIERASDAPVVVVMEDEREVPVRWVALTATDSLNRQFRLCYELLEGPQENRAPQVVLGKWRPNICGSHAVDSGEVHHYTYIAAENVEHVAAATGLLLARFVSRDMELRASLSVDGDVASHGRRVPLRLVVRNAGSNPVRWVPGWLALGDGAIDRSTYRVWHDGGRVIAKRDLDFFSSGPSGRDDSRPGGRHGSGLSMPDDLPSGGTYEDRDDLARWFDVSKPGRYRVNVEYYVNVVEPPVVFSAPMGCTTECDGFAQILTAECEFTVER